MADDKKLSDCRTFRAVIARESADLYTRMAVEIPTHAEYAKSRIKVWNNHLWNAYLCMEKQNAISNS